MTRPDEINVGQMTIKYLIDGSLTGGMGVFELTVPPGSNVPPPHTRGLLERSGLGFLERLSTLGEEFAATIGDVSILR